MESLKSSDIVAIQNLLNEALKYIDIYNDAKKACRAQAAHERKFLKSKGFANDYICTIHDSEIFNSVLDEYLTTKNAISFIQIREDLLKIKNNADDRLIEKFAIVVNDYSIVERSKKLIFNKQALITDILKTFDILLID